MSTTFQRSLTLVAEGEHYRPFLNLGDKKMNVRGRNSELSALAYQVYSPCACLTV